MFDLNNAPQLFKDVDVTGVYNTLDIFSLAEMLAYLRQVEGYIGVETHDADSERPLKNAAHLPVKMVKIYKELTKLKEDTLEGAVVHTHYFHNDRRVVLRHIYQGVFLVEFYLV